MKWSAWIPALLSIPISLLTGLAVRPIQEWYEGWGQSKEASKAFRRERGIQRIKIYVEEPHLFAEYLMKSIIDLIRYLSLWLIGMLVMTLFAIARVNMRVVGTMPKFDNYLTQTCFIGGSILSTIGLAMFTAKNADISRWWFMVKNAQGVDPKD